jgi:sigma-E factor negative regulatory protein RseC
MEVRARVLEIVGDRARLVCEDAGHCGRCASGRACGLRLFGASTRRPLDVPRRQGSEPPLETGDHVLLTVADGAILRAAATTYLPPVAGLLAGAALARMIGAGEAAAFGAALAGAVLGILLGRGAGPRRFRAVPVVRPGAGGPDD